MTSIVFDYAAIKKGRDEKFGNPFEHVREEEKVEAVGPGPFGHVDDAAYLALIAFRPDKARETLKWFGTGTHYRKCARCIQGVCIWANTIEGADFWFDAAKSARSGGAGPTRMEIGTLTLVVTRVHELIRAADALGWTP